METKAAAALRAAAAVVAGECAEAAAARESARANVVNSETELTTLRNACVISTTLAELSLIRTTLLAELL